MRTILKGFYMTNEHDFMSTTPDQLAQAMYDEAYNGFGAQNAPDPRAPDLLDAAAKTFRERNAIYGDTYLNFGVAAAACFPDGLSIEPGDTRSFNRLGVFVQCLGKLLRYGANFEKGGHQDSAHDLCVYAAMLEEVTE
jgi:hypothetical protein